jgi:hypothetical protein
VVHEAIDEGDGTAGVREDGRPVAEWQVCGEHETAFFVTAGDDLEEEIGGARVVGEMPDLVDQEQTAGGVVGEAPRKGAGGLLSTEVEQELGGGGEEHVGAGEDGGVRDVLGNHRFAQALRRDQHDIARVNEGVEPEHGLDGGAVDPLGPGPVEVAHGGEAADAAAGETALEAAARALLLLGLDEMLEELGQAPAPFGGEGDDVVEMGGGVTQTERGELISERSHRGSPRPPRAAASAGCRRHWGRAA